MRTTLNIDKDLIDYVVEATGEKTKSKAVTAALNEHTRRKKIADLRALVGKVRIDDTRAEQRKADRRRQVFLDEQRNG